MSGFDLLRVLSVPHEHPYVQAITDVARVQLVQPDPRDADTPVSWAPSPMLTETWVREHADDFDLAHVHFGFESFTLDHLQAFVRALADQNKPLVVSVHDLSNPQLEIEAQPDYLEKLGVLVRAADRVVTLTDAAAAEIASRFGARAVVVMHPPQLGVDAPEPAAVGRRPSGQPPRIGVLMKDARPSLDLDGLPVLARAAARSGARLDIVRHGRMRAGREALVARTLDALVGVSGTRVVTRERMSDQELITWVRELDLLALPYSHGTHSGLLELANELGTRSIIPPVGHFADQWAGVNEVVAFSDEDALVGAIGRALAAAPLQPQSRAIRHETLAAVQLEHLQLYRRVLSAREISMAHARALRILVIAPFRYPISQPHHGGLEAYVWTQVAELRARGHEVTLAAPAGSDAHDENTPEAMMYPRFSWPEGAPRNDITLPPGVPELETATLQELGTWVHEHRHEFDVVHNHAFHPEVFAWLPRIADDVAVVTTLHTPPLPEVLDALTRSGTAGRFIGVSPHTTAAWRNAAAGLDVTTIANAVDTAEWTFGSGGAGLVWFGRLVPEKAPHLALLVADALGVPLTVAGPPSAPHYVAQLQELASRCAVEVEFVGPLRQRQLADLVAKRSVTLVTPDWEEPFGLVVAESLACGTPVVAVRRGGLGEVFASVPGVHLVEAGVDERETVCRLVDATRAVLADQADPVRGPRLRAQARRSAVTRFSVDRHVDSVIELYEGELGRLAR